MNATVEDLFFKFTFECLLLFYRKTTDLLYSDLVSCNPAKFISSNDYVHVVSLGFTIYQII